MAPHTGGTARIMAVALSVHWQQPDVGVRPVSTGRVARVRKSFTHYDHRQVLWRRPCCARGVTSTD